MGIDGPNQPARLAHKILRLLRGGGDSAAGIGSRIGSAFSRLTHVFRYVWSRVGQNDPNPYPSPKKKLKLLLTVETVIPAIGNLYEMPVLKSS